MRVQPGPFGGYPAGSGHHSHMTDQPAASLLADRTWLYQNLTSMSDLRIFILDSKLDLVSPLAESQPTATYGVI